MEYTLTYSELAQGWVSFYSFSPDWMIGMNSYFYSFKGGNMYRHNTNATRNNFYGIQYPSQITSVFNDSPSENKLFKTISLQGDDSWSATIISDIQTTGYVEKAWFSKKENVYFAFIRNSGTVPASPNEYALRSLNGIGNSVTVGISPITAVEINFSTNPLIVISTITGVGDYLYFMLLPSQTVYFAGQIDNIIKDYPNGINQMIVNSNFPGAIYPIPIDNAYFFSIKNSVAESHGILGHYSTFTLENTNTTKIELFMAQAEIMKSFP
jgi:hypothetical protein